MGFDQITVERYSRAENVEGEFYAPTGSGYADYGPIKSEYDLSSGAKIFHGESSQDLAVKAGYIDSPLPDDIQKEFGIKTLREAGEEGMNTRFNDANAWYAVFQKAAERYLKAKGYQGAFWSHEDDLSPKQYQIWDKKIVKKRGGQ